MSFTNHPGSGPAMFRGDFEPLETEAIRRRLPHAELFLNIGANTGYFALQAAKLGLEVIAVEADPTNVKFLLKNAKDNNLGHKFTVISAAAGNLNQVVSLFGGSTGASLTSGWAGQRGEQLVPMVRLDDVIGSRLNGRSVLGVIDVEGAELEVIKGGFSSLASARKLYLMVEISGGGHDPTGFNEKYMETFELLFQLGLTCTTIAAVPHDVSIENVRQAVNQGRLDLGHNFLFQTPS